jgi:pimeloyl-ACP methyl ester carboxylesterase
MSVAFDALRATLSTNAQLFSEAKIFFHGLCLKTTADSKLYLTLHLSALIRLQPAVLVLQCRNRRAPAIVRQSRRPIGKPEPGLNRERSATMPKAPPDYQSRFPVDFGDIDPAVRQTVVQLYAPDGIKSRGLLYLPPGVKPRTVVIVGHPRGDMAQHYSIPYWVEAGVAAFALNTRYLNNDSTMLHENLVLDIAAAMAYLRDEQGFARIVMLGNSGGGSMFAYYDAEGRKPVGERVAAPPGGGPPDLNKFELPLADGFIVLAAHAGQGKILTGMIDPAVVDENDPYATNRELDMYDERNGFATPPALSHYAPDWLARYRAAQVSRVARLDAIAHRHIEEARLGRSTSRAADFAQATPAQRNFMQRRMMAPRIMIVHRTLANPNYHDLTLEPSERALGSIFAARPDLFNYHAVGLSRIVTPDAWLSTWSGLSSLANLVRNLPRITIPTLLVGGMADQDIFPSDVQAAYEQSGAIDKRIEFIAGADHFMRAGGTKAHLGDPRPRLMKLLTTWTRERFAP